MAERKNRGKEIASGILLLVPVAGVVWFCVYAILSDIVLQIWITNVVRVFIIAMSAVVAYFVLVLSVSNLKKAFELIFKIQTGKK